MIIVTGGAGFIGSNLIAGLNSKGLKDILVVDSLFKGAKYRNLRGLKFSDYIDKDDFFSLLDSGSLEGKKIDAVFHQGA
ncbi:MAG: NAD-dependent epimerase/dehydratase family protein, partial [Candidatus Cloacimonetes bacterium]|nr:NAD-dependent epimerase/dehydratase family protein [Candidatus Cloacimonadota bacterium]